MRTLWLVAVFAMIVAVTAASWAGLACGTRAPESKTTTTSGAGHVRLEFEDELADLEWEQATDPSTAIAVRVPVIEASIPEDSTDPDRDPRPVQEPDPAVTVRGHVLDDLGRPLPRARVELRGWMKSSIDGGTMRSLQRARSLSDESGAFELELAGRSEFEVAATHTGFLPLTMELGTLAPGGRIERLQCRLDRGRSISGRVLHADRSRAGPAHLRVERTEGRANGSAVFRAQADADGRFEVGGLAPGQYSVDAELYATPPGFAAGGADTSRFRKHHASAEHVLAGTRELELLLEPDFDVSGVAVDELGNPVPKFTLHARPSPSMRPSAGGTGRFRSFDDREGRFELRGLARGSWSVIARTAAGGRSLPQTLEVDCDLRDLRLVIERGHTLQGKVVEATGKGAAGAEVMATLIDERTRSLDSGLRTIEVSADDEGRFTIEGLHGVLGTEGALRFASRDGEREGRLRFTLNPGLGEEPLVLELPAPSVGPPAPRPFSAKRP